MSKIILTIIILVLIAIAVWVFFLVYGLYNPPGNQQQPTQTQNLVTNIIEGMKVETLREGKGNGARLGDVLVVNYIGTLEDGKKIDSSYDRNITFDFKLGEGRVIKGWDMGLIGMKVGEKRRLTVPPELAYGATGFVAAGIPENATMIFEIELLFIN